MPKMPNKNEVDLTKKDSMPREIIEFLKKEHILCISAEDYLASCFYAFCEKNLSLIFKSDPNSKHIKNATKLGVVGIAIAHHTKILHKIQGVQIKAKFTLANNFEKAIYYSRFPFALAHSGELFCARIFWCKFSDNSLPNKIIFERNLN